MKRLHIIDCRTPTADIDRHYLEQMKELEENIAPKLVRIKIKNGYVQTNEPKLYSKLRTQE